MLLLLFLSTFLIGSLSAGELPTENTGEKAIPDLDCIIEPSEVVDVGSAVPGVIESILAQRTDFVKKGGIVAELESSVERATLQLTKLRAELETAIALRQETASLGQRTQKRNQKLFSKSAISEQIMDETKTQTRIARFQVQQEKDNMRIAELEYLRSQAALQRRSIQSPVDGVVMERFKSVGEYVEDQPILRVAQLDPLHVEVIAPVESLGRIAPGMQADVTLGVPGFEIHQAKVERVDRVADAASGTYGVRLILSNPDFAIPAGIRCRLAFLPRDGEDPGHTAGNVENASPGEKDGEARTTENPVADSKPELTTSEPASEAPATVSTDRTEAKTKENLALTPQPESTIGDPVPEMPMTASIDRQEACYTIGPVATETLAGQLSEKLGVQHSSVILRKEPVEMEDGYRLLTAPEPDFEATRGLMNRLRSAGISDLYLLGEGDFAGRVSLGLFRNKNNVIRLQQRFVTKGFATEIVSHHKKTTLFWLDVSLKAGPDLPDQFQEVVASLAPSVSLKPLSCAPQMALGEPHTGISSQ